jgi:hypothetical protein
VSNPYGITGKELEVEATVKGFGNSAGLDLHFWADTLSGSYEELAKIKTKSLSIGEEASYTAKITPKRKDTIPYMQACTTTFEGLVGNLIQSGFKSDATNDR